MSSQRRILSIERQFDETLKEMRSHSIEENLFFSIFGYYPTGESGYEPPESKEFILGRLRMTVRVERIL